MGPLTTQPTMIERSSTACAYVLHGLNTNPDRMLDLKVILEGRNFRTTLGRLAGHTSTESDTGEISQQRWKTDFTEQWKQATAECRKSDDKRIFVAYSLGALTGMNVFDGASATQLPTQMILLSPALRFRRKVLLIKSIAWLPFGSLPSLNHPDYRAKNSTPLKSYQALFDLQNEWNGKAWWKTKEIPTLVVLSEKDELVDSQAIDHELKAKHIIQWKTLWLSNDEATINPRYYHLMIDPKTMGNKTWATFKKAAEEFLQSTAQDAPNNAK